MLNVQEHIVTNLKCINTSTCIMEVPKANNEARDLVGAKEGLLSGCQAYFLMKMSRKALNQAAVVPCPMEALLFFVF